MKRYSVDLLYWPFLEKTHHGLQHCDFDCGIFICLHSSTFVSISHNDFAAIRLVTIGPGAGGFGAFGSRGATMETGENGRIEPVDLWELLRRCDDPLVSFRSFCFAEGFLDTVLTLPDSGRDGDCLRLFVNFMLSL